MFSPAKINFNNQRIKPLTDMRNIAMYIFLLIVFAITWSAIKTVQNNYDLQKKISTLKQQNSVLNLQNQDTQLKNQYYQTSEYLDLAARQDLGLAAPGEQVLLIPKNVALKYIDPKLAYSSAVQSSSQATGIRKNIQDWRNFLLGRNLAD